jgi:protein TonB
MKSIITVFLIVSLLTGTYSCQQRKKVELLQNKEKDYTIIKSNPWDKKKEDVFSFDFDVIKKWSNAIKKVQQMVKTDKDHEDFEYALYVNENGEIDKIKPLKSSFPEIDQFLAEQMSDWQMVTYIKNGKPHKYRIDLNFTIWKNKKGIMDVINSNFPIIDTYEGEDFITYTDNMPAPIGGIRTIQEKIHYPKTAEENGVEGRVYVKAYIDKNGNVAAAQIIKGIGSGCDEAAIKAVKETKFIPASNKNGPIGAQVAIPILFKLDSKKEKK